MKKNTSIDVLFCFTFVPLWVADYWFLNLTRPDYFKFAVIWFVLVFLYDLA